MPDVRAVPGGGVRMVHDGYRPGACNIGPREIAQRRAFGIAGLVAAVAVAVGLAAVGAPTPVRLLVVAPLWGSFIGFYQARRRFCVRFAFEGRSNFGGVGDDVRIAEDAARRADRRAAVRMIAICGAGAAVVGAVVVLLPI